jgi:hypothetical protein
MSRRERRREEEKARPNRYRRQGVRLVGALPCSKDASEGDTLRAYVPLPAGSLGVTILSALLYTWGVSMDGQVYPNVYL